MSTRLQKLPTAVRFESVVNSFTSTLYTRPAAYGAIMVDHDEYRVEIK